MSAVNQIDTDDLETMIDQHGLAAVLEALAFVCHEKADHCITNWQDRTLAIAWRKAAQAVEHASQHRAIQGAPL